MRMNIQFLNGGLAIQAFHYIYARYYELSHPGDCMYMDDTYFALHTVHNGYELEKVFEIRPHMLSECFDEKVWNFILEERKSGKSVPQIFLENKIDIQMLTEVGTYETFNPFCGTVLGIPSNGYHPEILDVYVGAICIIMAIGSIRIGLKNIILSFCRNFIFQKLQMRGICVIRNRFLRPIPLVSM